MFLVKVKAIICLFCLVFLISVNNECSWDFYIHFSNFIWSHATCFPLTGWLPPWAVSHELLVFLIDFLHAWSHLYALTFHLRENCFLKASKQDKQHPLKNSIEDLDETLTKYTDRLPRMASACEQFFNTWSRKYKIAFR